MDRLTHERGRHLKFDLPEGPKGDAEALVGNRRGRKERKNKIRKGQTVIGQKERLGTSEGGAFVETMAALLQRGEKRGDLVKLC